MLNLPTKKPTICSINVPLFVALSTKLSKLLFQSSHPNKNASPEKEDQRNSGVTWVTTLLMVPMCFHDAHQSLVNHYMVFFLHPPECLQRILIFTRQMHQKDRGASFLYPKKESIQIHVHGACRALTCSKSNICQLRKPISGPASWHVNNS